MEKQVTDKIRKLREAKGVSQENVADELEINASSYAKIERGETDPSLSRLVAIAKFLEVDITDFFKFDEVLIMSEPKVSYGSNKEDFEKIYELIHIVYKEIGLLRAELAEKNKLIESMPKKRAKRTDL